MFRRSMEKFSDFFKNIKKWIENHKTIFALLVTALFVGAHIPLLMNHEVTNDEAIVWGLSKEVNLSNAYELNSAEPHPLLWQFMLAPLSQNNLPLISMSILSLALVVLAVFLFVRFAPFGFLAKLIFLLSSSFCYFNPIIARDYSLIPLAICLISLAYKSRHEKPFRYGLSLVLLSQTHFLMYGLLAVLVLGFFAEELFAKKSFSKKLLALLLCFLPVGLSVLSSVPLVINSFNNQAIINGEATSDTEAGGILENTIGAYFGYYVIALNVISIVAAVIIILNFFAANLKIGLYFLAGTGLWYYVLANIYQSYYYFDQKVTILSLMMLLSLWLIKLEKEEKHNFLKEFVSHSEIVKILKKKVAYPAVILPCFIVMLTIPHAFVVANNEMNLATNSSEQAAFINKTVEDGALIIEGDIAASVFFDAATHLQVEKDVTYYDVPLDSYDDYHIKLRYDGVDDERYRKFNRLSDEALSKLIAEASAKYEHIYYVSTILTNCKGESTDYNAELVANYERLATLNDGKYMTNLKNVPLSFYRVK